MAFSGVDGRKIGHVRGGAEQTQTHPRLRRVEELSAVGVRGCLETRPRSGASRFGDRRKDIISIE